MSVMRIKPIEASLAEGDEPEYQLKKRLTAVDLTVFGVGVVIGAGIFTLTGRAARDSAGPAIVISFAIAALCCALAALCYAEFAAAVPVSGSAYTFSYSSLGELIAWIIGWDLLLELMLGASVVAQGWSAYLGVFLDRFDMSVPASVAYGSDFDLPAFVLVAVLTALVAFGIKESMRVNLVLVALKLFIVLFVIVAGLAYVKGGNYTPFVPEAIEKAGGGHWETSPLIEVLFGLTPTQYGIGGVMAGASLVFFAYIGFDVVATTAEEAKNPQRDLPIGIIASLLICTTLYCAVALVITGMVPYQEIDDAALATAFETVGRPGFATLVAAGAVAGLTTVVMTLLIGASRVVFAMSRDWLLPAAFGKVNPKTGTPVRITLTIGATVALVAALTPVGKLEYMVNIGTLAAFTLVSIAVPILRKRRPDLERPFKVPFSPVLPIVSALICFYLMLTLPVETWIRFMLWMLLGVIVYFVYGYRNSRLAKGGFDTITSERSTR